MEIEQVTVNGVKIYPFESKRQLLEFLSDVDSGVLAAVNARKIMTSPEHVKRMISENIGYFDGFGAIWALRRTGYKGKPARIPGVELWLDIIDRFPDRSYYLLGARQEVIERAVERLKKESPNVKISGYRNGYFDREELPAIGEEIKKKNVDTVFVAMGSPRQEEVMCKLKEAHNALYMGLGGSFDVYVGEVKRAPRSFRMMGMEAFYRFASNPKRMFNRKMFYCRYFFKLLLGGF